ncbi:hypothetical protein QW131_21460 [Roseibium salinum]|nr:hypothetical protein [Roseibium salinum]
MLVAAVIGGILVLGGGFGLYQAGLVKLTPEPDQQMARSLTSAERKISELERQLADVSAGAANQNTGSAVSALETKVSSLESRLEKRCCDRQLAGDRGAAAGHRGAAQRNGLRPGRVGRGGACRYRAFGRASFQAGKTR